MMKKIWHILPDLLRRLILAWLASVLLVYFLLPNQQRKLEKNKCCPGRAMRYIAVICIIICFIS